MSVGRTVKIVGLGALAITLGVEWLDRLFRRPCPCPLPHGLDTPFTRLLQHLLSASMSLDLCVFAFSSQELSRAVLLLQTRGVAVRVVTDKDYMAITGSQIGTLRNAGISVRHEMGAVHMHHKFAVVDSRLLITGSLNWTLTAIQSNKENILVTEEPDLVFPFVREFQQLWDSNDPARHYPSTSNTLALPRRAWGERGNDAEETEGTAAL
ncbi:hypothetical protein JZ751_005318 [Albula glossodonta]|uniref:Mitochondrial cardiolipin hydrolase n=1 Tax=Albula glossodonta TaxID=121402 RepID=A0A8T2MUU0_9TELE|nr:hypothetical protein JZ751_005318 [Albula glossodonta]